MNSEIVLLSVTKKYRTASQEVTILNELDATFKQGVSYAITGSSGVGKSTLLHCIAGIDKPSSGQILCDGKSIYDVSDAERHIWFSRTVGLAFQQPYLIPELTVRENVLLKALVDRVDLPEAQQEAEELLHLVGLEDKIDESPSSLSGGQQQRVALARALLYKPAFLLVDELTGNLDQKTGGKIVDLVMRYQKEHAMGLIVISHDQSVTQRMEIVFNLQNGKLVHV